MTLTIPAAVPSLGTRRVVALDTVADITAITLAEITAGENISCYLTRQNGWQPTKDQTSIPDTRYCSAQDFEVPGSKTRTLLLQYTFNLNLPTADEARLGLIEGSELTLVHFIQKEDGDDEFAADDWYEAVPVRMGEQNIVPMEENALDRMLQKAFIRGEWTGLHQLAAA